MGEKGKFPILKHTTSLTHIILNKEIYGITDIDKVLCSIPNCLLVLAQAILWYPWQSKDLLNKKICINICNKPHRTFIVRYLKFARYLYVKPGKFKIELRRIISIDIQYKKWKISRLLRLILYQQLFFFKEIITLLFIVSNFHIIKRTSNLGGNDKFIVCKENVSD